MCSVDEILDDETDDEKILDTSDCCLMPSVEMSNFQFYIARSNYFLMR